jgi:hypothetical protein
MGFGLDSSWVEKLSAIGDTHFLFKSSSDLLSWINSCRVTYNVETNTYSATESNSTCTVSYVKDPDSNVSSLGNGKISIMISWFGTTGSASVTAELEDICGNNTAVSASKSW